jgi:hypothetical protein
MGDSQPAVMGACYVDDTARERCQGHHRNVAPLLLWRIHALVRIALAYNSASGTVERPLQLRKLQDGYSSIFIPPRVHVRERGAIGILSVRETWTFQWPRLQVCSHPLNRDVS